MDQYDNFASVRAAIEARMKILNEEHKARCKARPDKISESHQTLHAETIALYAWAEKNKGKVMSDED